MHHVSHRRRLVFSYCFAQQQQQQQQQQQSASQRRADNFETTNMNNDAVRGIGGRAVIGSVSLPGEVRLSDAGTASASGLRGHDDGWDLIAPPSRRKESGRRTESDEEGVPRHDRRERRPNVADSVA